MKIRLFLVFLLAASIAAGCGTSTPTDVSPSPTGSSPAKITPYTTNTPQIPNTPTPQTIPTKTPLPLPTATPFLYTVVENDTLIGIATTFGVTLDELMIVNPDVNPNALSIGTQLIIPLPQQDEGEDSQAAAVVEVLPLQTSPTSCYPVRSGGLWCLWLVTNTLEQYAENIEGFIHLYNAQDEQSASQKTTMLLNVLKPGESIPLYAYFPPPVPQWVEAQGQLTSAVAANQYESRYLNTTIEQLTISPPSPADTGEESQSVLVSGRLNYTTTENANTPDYAWVTAVAYDDSDSVVGIRRWEAAEIPTSGGIDFNFEVYSLGKPIARVEVLAEVPAPLPSN